MLKQPIHSKRPVISAEKSIWHRWSVRLIFSGTLALAGCGAGEVPDVVEGTDRNSTNSTSPQPKTKPDEVRETPTDNPTGASSDSPPVAPDPERTAPVDDSIDRQGRAIGTLQSVGGLVRISGGSMRLLLGSNRQMTDDRLASVKDIAHVQWIRLQNNPQVTDAALIHFSELDELEELVLTGTSISDAGLRHLAGLSTLRLLVLNRTSISDAALVHLKGLENLERLFLIETNVTDQGVEDLKTSLPQCVIRK